MTVLAENFTDVTPDHFIAGTTPNNALGVYLDGAGEDSRSVTVHLQEPVGADLFAMDTELRQSERRQANVDYFPDDLSVVRTLGHYSEAMSTFRAIKHYPAIVEALGCRTLDDIEELGGVKHTWTTITYPTVASLNRALDELDPDGSVRYEEHPGGEYNGVDTAEALSRGHLLVSTDTMYEIHDHTAPHVLGSLGLEGELMDDIQSYAAAYLKRHKAELELPPVPNISASNVAEFLRPSRAVLKALVLGMDSITGNIGLELFVSPNVTNNGSSPVTRLISVISSILSVNLDDRLPFELYKQKDHKKLEGFAGAILDKYDELEGRATIYLRQKDQDNSQVAHQETTR